MIRLVIQSATGEGDVERDDDGSLLDDDGLETVVTISLHTDAKATPEQLSKYGLPQRGYWFDAYDDDPALNTGSLLWLLEGSVLNADALADAKTFADDALAWMVESGAASAVENVVSRLGDDAISGETKVYMPSDPRSPYTLTWERHFAV